jgi:ferredoxin--NADP+ reductase
VIGNGNVAVDVARVLVRSRDELALTDISDDALEALRACGIREVVMLGRRGPAQGKFTSVELKEFGALEGVDVVVDPADLELDPDSEASLEDNKVARKNVQILRDFAALEPGGMDRRIVLRFCASPVEFLEENGRVSGVRVERNRLVREPNGYMRSEGTGEFETIDTNLVLRSVGYRGVPLPGVPFDESRAIIRNSAGRVLDDADTPVPGEYVVGWAKRGPSGIIGTNKPDSVATVEAMVEDLPVITPIEASKRDPDSIVEELRRRGIDYVSFPDWKQLDSHEVARGEPDGRPRAKVARVEDMMRIIRGG